MEAQDILLLLLFVVILISIGILDTYRTKRYIQKYSDFHKFENTSYELPFHVITFDPEVNDIIEELRNPNSELGSNAVDFYKNLHTNHINGSELFITDQKEITLSLLTYSLKKSGFNSKEDLKQHLINTYK